MFTTCKNNGGHKNIAFKNSGRIMMNDTAATISKGSVYFIDTKVDFSCFTSADELAEALNIVFALIALP